MMVKKMKQQTRKEWMIQHGLVRCAGRLKCTHEQLYSAEKAMVEEDLLSQ